MFDIGAMELLVIVIVAVIVIGPKDMPLAMRAAGRWIGKVRKVSAHFRSGIDSIVREAELEDMEKKWKARNEEIMRQHPTAAEDTANSASADAAAVNMAGPPEAGTTNTSPIDEPVEQAVIAEPAAPPPPPADAPDKA
ncbi:MAG: Sec-independent protein translocase protein TatB [Pseudomonadota bacterium]